MVVDVGCHWVMRFVLDSSWCVGGIGARLSAIRAVVTTRGSVGFVLVIWRLRVRTRLRRRD
jgi:hypothetical protein